MCVEGLVDESSLLFSKPNKTFCKWLVCNRKRHTYSPPSIQSVADIGTWKNVAISGQQDEVQLNDILCKTEYFNTEALRIIKKQKRITRHFYLVKNVYWTRSKLFKSL
jgi:hypothetical protein